MKRLYFWLFLCLAMIFWQLWLPFPKVANDFPLISDSTFDSFFDIPRVWLERGAGGFGEYIVYSLWTWPFMLVSGVIVKLGLSFVMLEKLVYFIPALVIGVTGIVYLTLKIGLSKEASFVAGLLYMANSYLVLLLDGGQLMMVLAYGFFPWSYTAVKRSVTDGLQAKVLAGVAVFILGVFDIRIVYVLLLLVMIESLYEFFLKPNKVKQWLLDWGGTGLVICLVFIGLNGYWIAVIIQQSIPSEVFQKLTSLGPSSLLKLGHPMLLLAPNWPNNVYGQITSLKIEFSLIPLLALFAVVFRFGDQRVRFWGLVAVIGIFLAKGEAIPYPQVYRFLYTDLPGFSLFRDSTKFYFLVALSYAILVGISVDVIGKKMARLNWLVAVLLSVYLIFLIRPVWLAQMSGVLSIQPYQKGFLEVTNQLTNDRKFSRVLWLPSQHPLGYSDVDHTPINGLELSELRPFAINNIGLYERFNFLREAPFMGELFNIFGIGYIAYPPLDPRRVDQEPDDFRYYDLFLNQISQLPWVEPRMRFGIPLIKVSNHQDRIFVADNLWFVIGSDKIYGESTKSANLSLENNSLVFTEEKVGLCQQLGDFPQAKLVLFDKSSIDFLGCFFDQNSLIVPANKLSNDPDQTGWWRRKSGDFAWFKDFLMTKYQIENQDFDFGKGWAIAEGSLKLKLAADQISAGRVLFARVMESSKGGKLSFWQEGNRLGTIETVSEKSNVRWFEVGKIVNNQPIEVVSNGSLNVINVLAALDQSSLEIARSQVSLYQRRVEPFVSPGNDDKSVSLRYRRLNSTKYLVSVTGLDQPHYLVFSSSYSPFWKLNGQSSVPVYSMLNGFLVEKDGEYILEYILQDQVLLGLSVSMVTAGFVVFILARRNKKNV